VISHDKESTERLFRKVKYFLENIRGPKAVIDTSSKRELTFPKTNSVFYIGTAGARKFGRGDTISDLHCSEVAFWEAPEDLLAGLFQAVPRSGTIGLESTGNGRNLFYRRVMSASEGKGRYKLHFFDWLDFPEYDLEVEKEEANEIVMSLDPDLEEDVLYHQTELTPGQLKFRREKLEDVSYDLTLFKQEYPITLDECFRATGKSIFHKVLYVQVKGWKRHDRDLYILDGHPRPDGKYAIGADVGGGIGGDKSVAEIFDIEEMEQVGEWVSDRTSPDVFGHRLLELGRIFNQAYITVESNNYGTTTLDNMMKAEPSYPQWLIHKKTIKSKDADNKLLSLGYYQTSRTKPLAVGTLRTMLATCLKIHSPALMDELGTYVEDENGKLGAESGCFDDRVMASAVAAQTWPRAALLKSATEPPPAVEVVDPFSLDSIIDEMRGRGAGFPIRPQVRIS
jgi:hypothetical protein